MLEKSVEDCKSWASKYSWRAKSEKERWWGKNPQSSKKSRIIPRPLAGFSNDWRMMIPRKVSFKPILLFSSLVVFSLLGQKRVTFPLFLQWLHRASMGPSMGFCPTEYLGPKSGPTGAWGAVINKSGVYLSQKTVNTSAHFPCYYIKLPANFNI